MAFDDLWARLTALEGDVFFRRAPSGPALSFTYRVQGSALIPSGTELLLDRSLVQAAYERRPLTDPDAIIDLSGHAFIWAILSDPRVATYLDAPDHSKVRRRLLGEPSFSAPLPDLPPTVLTAARIFLRPGPLTVEDLAARMRESGWYEVTSTALRPHIEAHPHDFDLNGDTCSLASGSQVASPATRASLALQEGRPVSGSRQSKRPVREYERPAFHMHPQSAQPGRVGDESFTTWEPKLRELLSWGDYRVITIERDPVGATPAWPIHLMRLLVEDVPAFVAMTYLPAGPRVQAAITLGWDIWSPQGPIDWRDDRLLVPVGWANIDEAAATWRAPSADILATAVCHFIHSGMRCRNPQALTVDVVALDPLQLLRREQSGDVKRAIARSLGSDSAVLGRCRECNRPLRDPASAARGFGPECWEKVMNRRASRSGIPHLSLRRYLAGALTMTEWPRFIDDSLRRDRARLSPR